MPRRGRGPQRSRRKGTFEINAANVRHTQIGVWHLYEDVPAAFATIPRSLANFLQPVLELRQSLPYLWRMLKDISTVQYSWALLGTLLVLELVLSLLPAAQLWYGGQFLDVVETAVNTRTVDKNTLVNITAGQFACSVAGYILKYGRSIINRKLNSRIRTYYATHNFYVVSRLDAPTYCNDATQQQLQTAITPRGGSSIAWQTVTTTISTASTFITLASQFSVLVSVLRRQPDGPLLAFLSFLKPLWTWATASRTMYGLGVWAATTNNEDFIRSEGLKKAITDPAHRQEIVAGNMWEYMLDSYREAMGRLGDSASHFFLALSEHTTYRFKLSSLLNYPLSELPRIIFTLRAVQHPSDIPLSLASFNLVTSTASSFSHTIIDMLRDSGSIADNFDNIRRLYEAENMENKVKDGSEPYPENQTQLQHGIEIEFKHVSFSYADKDLVALHDVSFKILAGQLCVIIGRNGSGKSTILKLIARIYDPDEGDILIDGRNIRMLKLADLRATMSVLFQDYTHFPLSIKDNIGLGCPAHANDMDKIEEAARLGGAYEFVSELEDGFDTYLDRPVSDVYANLPEGTNNLFGRAVDYGAVRGAGKMKNSSSKLSGGQMQRIALSRTFMHSFDEDRPVGLLLFDEPSASLDPIAEHDLFERLRKLRGSKTMVFSSHRFGNLTRHADVILYINDAEVIEQGTHEQLMKKEGGNYAEIWSLQAQAFIA